MPNATIDILKSHRSIRNYKPETIPDRDIHFAIDAGQAASTSSAVQAYSVIHIRDESLQQQFVELTSNQDKVAACGAFFVICGDSRRHRILCEASGKPYSARFEAFLLAVIDATLFAQNFVVAFESMGYGICYIGGLRSHLQEADRLLNLPEGVYPLFGLCVGVPDESPLARPRLPLEAVLFDNAYPSDEEMLGAINNYDQHYLAYLDTRGVPKDSQRTWSDIMNSKFSTPAREDIADYYLTKGANLS